MRFWDSSAVLPLLVHEATSAAMLAALREDDSMVAWWGTRLECISALCRLERDGALSAEGLSSALADLRRLAACWSEVEPADVLRECAERLLRVHPLRAADSLQLAAAIVAAQHRPSTLLFVCLDGRLAAAAEREGFPVTPG